MKVLVLTLCIFLVSVHGHKIDSKSEKAFQECLDENDIKEADLKNAESKDDPKMRCIMACMFEKGGILKNGDIDKEAMKKDLSTDVPELGEKDASEVVDKCVDMAAELSDICEKTSVIGICVKEEFDRLNIKMDD